MASKKQVRDLIKTLKEKTGKTQEQLSEGAGYKPKTLTQILSKGEDLEPVYNQLRLVYAGELNISTNDQTGVEANLKSIHQTLKNIQVGQHALKAEIRGYGKYLVMNANDFDEERYRKAQELVDKIYFANLPKNDARGKKNGESI